MPMKTKSEDVIRWIMFWGLVIGWGILLAAFAIAVVRSK